MSIPDYLRQRKKALTVAEVADLLSVNKFTVYRYVERGELKAYRVFSSLRFDPHTVANWLDSRTC